MRHKSGASNTRLIGIFLTVTVVPFVAVVVVSLVKTGNALTTAAYHELEAAQTIKHSQINSYFEERFGNLSVLSKNDTVISALEAFTCAFEREHGKGGEDEGEDCQPSWAEVEATFSGWLTTYKEEYGYYDLFLISKSGDVVYTVARESDFAQNLATGPLGASGLGQCFRGAAGGTTFVDFRPYAPSNDDPAAFIGAPVKKDGATIGVVALQLQPDAINRIMQERAGMGETGETYLVGPDKLMRSDSYLDRANHTVVASFANPTKGTVDTEASREALGGNRGQGIITDYSGNPVLSVFAPLEVSGVRWAMIAEIDEAEALAAVSGMRWLISLLAVAGIGVIVAAAAMIYRSFSRPVFRAVEDLSDSFDQVAAAAGQVSTASQALAGGSSEQAASLEETSASLEEMSAGTKRNADNAQQANALMEETKRIVASANESMDQLAAAMVQIRRASEETSKIIKTIDEIAFQTNLLALNAAVEAARAGSAGAGFAVVADEVRSLAMRAADAAKNTASLIEDTTGKVKGGSTLAEKAAAAFSDVQTSASKVAELVAEIATSSDEQATGIENINRAVAEMEKVTQKNAASAEESASAAEQMTAQSETVRGVVRQLSSIVGRAESGSFATAREVTVRDPSQFARVAGPSREAPVRAAVSGRATDPEWSAEDEFPMEKDEPERAATYD